MSGNVNLEDSKFEIPTRPRPTQYQWTKHYNKFKTMYGASDNLFCFVCVQFLLINSPSSFLFLVRPIFDASSDPVCSFNCLFCFLNCFRVSTILW